MWQAFSGLMAIKMSIQDTIQQSFQRFSRYLEIFQDIKWGKYLWLEKMYKEEHLQDK